MFSCFNRNLKYKKIKLESATTLRETLGHVNKVFLVFRLKFENEKR